MTKRHDPVVESLVEAVLSARIPNEARLLVAVSGGPDSVALLHVLHQLSAHNLSTLPSDAKPLAGQVNQGFSWRLFVGHVNHDLRGAESDRDELFVGEISQRLGLEVQVEHVDVLAHARENRMSVEAASRELRWASLRRMALERGADFIVTGHTLTDQAETILMRLLRGSGIIGLGGMKQRSDGIIRPFLTVPHETILDYLDEYEIAYRKDSSNSSPDHLRNRLRMETIPKLREIQPRFDEILGRTGQLLEEDAEFILTQVTSALELMDVRATEREISGARASWLSLHPSLRGHCLRLLVDRLVGSTIDLNEEHVELLSTAIAGEGTKNLMDQLPHELLLQVDDLRFTLRTGYPPPFQRVPEVNMPLPGTLELESGSIGAVVYEREALDLEKLLAVRSPWHALCDADRLGPSLTVRSRLPGDVVRPVGGSGSRKVKEIFIDRRVPKEVRDAIPILANGDSIVWVAGIALDERAAITPDTTRVMHLTFRPSSWLAMVLKCDCFPTRK